MQKSGHWEGKNLMLGLTFCHAQGVLSPELTSLTHDADILVPEQVNMQKLSKESDVKVKHQEDLKSHKKVMRKVRSTLSADI